jgi:hypothetical protein
MRFGAQTEVVMSFIMAQGLMGGGLLTQGWSSPSPSSSMITQGLLGPQLLLQGLVGAHNVYAMTPNGGLGLSGSARRRTMLTTATHGGVWLGAQHESNVNCYRVYVNQGLGDPINYATPVGAVTSLGWTSDPLSVPGQYRLGVRAFDSFTGLEEQNVDAAVLLSLDAAGNDVTKVPFPPVGLRAFPKAGGAVRVEWVCPTSDPSSQPNGFHVYITLGPTVDYSEPATTVPWSSGRFGAFMTDQAGLTDGFLYSIGVRAFSANGEEANTVAVTVKADGTPPSLVDSLEAIAINQEL